MSPVASPKVVLYSAGHECRLCDRAKAALATVAAESPFAWTVIDVDDDPDLSARYGKRLPVLSIGGKDVLEGRFDAAAVRAAIEKGSVERAPRGRTLGPS